MTLPRLLSLLPIAVALTAAPLAAQDDLRVRINELFTFGDCGVPLCLDVPGEHGNHFLPSITAGGLTVIGVLAEAIGRAAANTPLSATSSGATFAIVNGLPVRTSTSAGPIFGERSQTLGRGRFFLGANVTGLSFSSLNGAPMNNVIINFIHQDVGAPGLGDPFYENDVVQVRMRMDVRLTVASIFATLGVTDFLDIGVAVPFVRTSIDGGSEVQILPFGSTALHNFGFQDTIPILRAASGLNANAAGLGDVVARLKINIAQSSRFGAALLGDIRFPTGREEDLLGSGSTNIRALGVASMQFGSFSPHVNVGYQARNGQLQNDGVLFNIGFDNLMTERITLAVDFVTERQVGANKLELPGDAQWDTPFTRILPQVNVPNARDNIFNLSVGTKFTLRGGTVFVLNGIVPLRSAGLQPDIVWTAGIEGAF